MKKFKKSMAKFLAIVITFANPSLYVGATRGKKTAPKRIPTTAQSSPRVADSTHGDADSSHERSQPASESASQKSEESSEKAAESMARPGEPLEEEPQKKVAERATEDSEHDDARQVRWKRLYQASEAGDLVTVKDLVGEFGVDACDGSGYTILMCAAEHGHMNIVEFLVSNGADVNFKECSGYTALMAAASGGNLEILKFLLDHGANGETSEQKSRALYIAVSRYRDSTGISIINTLLQRGAKVSSDHLSCAVSDENESVLATLLEHADANAKNGFGKFESNTVLTKAVEGGKEKCVKLLLDAGADINLPNKEGRTPLMVLLRLFSGEDKHRIEILKMLLDRGAKLDVRDSKGDAALIYAVKSRSALAVEMVLEKCTKTDLDVQDNDGKTALMHAICNKQWTNAGKLLEKGASPNVQDNAGKTALMYAVEFDDISRAWDYYGKEKIDILLDKGADVNIRDNAGKTVLTMTAERSKYNIFRELVHRNKIGIDDENKVNAVKIAEQQGNQEAINLLGDTPLMVAAEKGDLAGVNRWLSTPNVNVNTRVYDETALIKAAEAGHNDIVIRLLEAGANKDEEDICGETPLMKAVKGGYIEVVKTLLGAGATVDKADHSGETAWIKAAKNGQKDVAACLLDNKPDFIDTTDRDGRTALMLVARNSESAANEEFAKYLLSKQASVNLRDNDGSTALMYAAWSGNGLVANHLLNCHGIDVHVKDHDGSTALQVAVRFNKSSVVWPLLLYSQVIPGVTADPTRGVTDEDRNKAKQIAVQYGYREILDVFNTFDGNKD